MILIIVESPKKAKIFKKLLGDQYQVIATIGHICDLPEKGMNVDIENRFKPTYEISDDKRKTVSQLEFAAKKASEIYLATDADREGEAIAWHVKRILGLKKYKRITFNSISKKSITEAMNNPRDIDLPMVHAYEARRILDRLTGYTISPELKEKSGGAPLSAGRVQSVAIKILTDLEREIESFISVEHYGVKLKLENGAECNLITKPLADKNGYITDRTVCEDLAKTKNVQVTSIEEKERDAQPPKPFTTLGILKAASKKLKFDPADTTKLLQKLYEEGHVTYIRSDDPNISDEAFDEIAGLIRGKGVEPVRRKYKAKDNAQEAHECIRPTNINAREVGESQEEKALYGLIRLTTIASCMPPAKDSVTTVTFTPVPESDNVQFEAKGVVEVEPGFRKILGKERSENEDPEIPPGMLEGNNLSVIEGTVLDKATKPPSRLSIDDLMDRMEKNGIGRPSTYASTVSLLLRKEYALVDQKRKLLPSNLGWLIADSLSDMEFMKIQFTQDMEKSLDEISAGQLKTPVYLDKFYKQLLADLPKITVNPELVQKHVDATQIDCPKCGKKLKEIMIGSKRTFVHASGDHGECQQYIESIRGKPYFSEDLDVKCSVCGGELERRYSSKQKKHFWVHTEEGSCEVKFIDDKAGKPQVKNFSKCPMCGKALKRIKSKNKDAPKGRQWFWVHVNEPDDCQKFLSDSKGRPVAKKEASDA